MKIKCCIICGGKIIGRAHNAKTCSPEHTAKNRYNLCIPWRLKNKVRIAELSRRAALKKWPRYNKQCVVCEKGFVTGYNKQKTCSSECLKTLRRKTQRISRRNNLDRDAEKARQWRAKRSAVYRAVKELGIKI